MQAAKGSKLVTMESDFETEKLKDDDARFRAGVKRGIDQADRGEFIEEAEMDARIKRMMSGGETENALTRKNSARNKKRK